MHWNLLHGTSALSLGLIFILSTPLIARAGDESAKVPTGDDYLTPRFSAGQTYSNVFSILSSKKADGYDERAGRNGASGEASTVQLNHNGQTESFDVTPGISHWKGYTTFVRGIVFCDELLVTRDDILHGKDGKTVSFAGRRIMLLNAAPFPTLSQSST